MSHFKKHAQQVMPLARNALKINQRGILLKDVKKCSIKSIKGEILKNGTRYSYGSCAQPFESLQETCIHVPSLKSFEHMVTMFRSRQEML